MTKKGDEVAFKVVRSLLQYPILVRGTVEEVKVQAGREIAVISVYGVNWVIPTWQLMTVRE